MRTKLLLLCTLAACGGGDDSTGDDDAPVLEGGRFEVEGCGFDVITRPGAEAPAPGAPTIGADPAPRQIRLGFAGDPTTSIAVVWRTDVDTTASTIRYGTGDSLDQTGEGVTYRYIDGFDGNGETVRIHEAHLCGLEPDTEYSYQVGAEGAFSDTYTFRTAPDITANPDAQVTIAYVGDSRNGEDVWAEIAAEIETHAPDLVVYTGDVVTIGVIQAEWDAFLDAAPGLLASAPMVTSHGNHELNSIVYYSTFAMPGDEENYSFDYGHAHLAIVNTDPAVESDLGGPVADFLDADLTAADATWSIVNMHRAIYSSSVNHGADTMLLDTFGPIIDAHQVDVVFAGHDHIYERSKPLRGDVVGATPADGTIYIVSGGAGAPLYTLLDPLPEHSDFAATSYNFTIVQVGPLMLQTATYREDGSMLDQFAISP